MLKNLYLVAFICFAVIFLDGYNIGSGYKYRLITKLLSTYIISLGSKNNIFTTNFSTF